MVNFYSNSNLIYLDLQTISKELNEIGKEVKFHQSISHDKLDLLSKALLSRRLLNASAKLTNLSPRIRNVIFNLPIPEQLQMQRTIDAIRSSENKLINVLMAEEIPTTENDSSKTLQEIFKIFETDKINKEELQLLPTIEIDKKAGPLGGNKGRLTEVLKEVY